ncbi:hypothetical protein HYU06_01730 [Candidatus Woesearchaeota archaeon]|nr:hypothetical protein [Candidatus Woesearchaeota archaeon]
MKHKLCISIDIGLVRKIEEFLEDGRFRNKSHIIEYAVNKLLKGEE